jgi:ATP-dependent DNA ligase
VNPIIPIVHWKPFSHPDWYDGFRGIADTVHGRMLSRNRHHLKRYDALLCGLPAGCILDGEIVVLDGQGRPQFKPIFNSAIC